MNLRAQIFLFICLIGVVPESSSYADRPDPGTQVDQVFDYLHLTNQDWREEMKKVLLADPMLKRYLQWEEGLSLAATIRMSQLIQHQITLALSSDKVTPAMLKSFWEYLLVESKLGVGRSPKSDQLSTEILQVMGELYFDDPNSFGNVQLHETSEEAFYKKLNKLSDGAVSIYFTEHIIAHPENKEFTKLYIRFVIQKAERFPGIWVRIFNDFFEFLSDPRNPLGWALGDVNASYREVLLALLVSTPRLDPLTREMIFKIPTTAPLLARISAEAGKYALSIDLTNKLITLTNAQKSIGKHLSYSDVYALLEEEFPLVSLDPENQHRLNVIFKKALEARLQYYKLYTESNIGFLLFYKITEQNAMLTDYSFENFYQREFFPIVFKIFNTESNNAIKQYVRPFHDTDLLRELLLEYYFQHADDQYLGKMAMFHDIPSLLHIENVLQNILLYAPDESLFKYKDILLRHIDANHPLYSRIQLSRWMSSQLSSIKEIQSSLAVEPEFKKHLANFFKGIAKERSDLFEWAKLNPILMHVLRDVNFSEVFGTDRQGMSDQHEFLRNFLTNYSVKPKLDEKGNPIPGDNTLFTPYYSKWIPSKREAVDYLLIRQNMIKQYLPTAVSSYEESEDLIRRQKIDFKTLSNKVDAWKVTEIPEVFDQSLAFQKWATDFLRSWRDRSDQQKTECDYFMGGSRASLYRMMDPGPNDLLMSHPVHHN